jgi:hypothetical protein
MKARTLATSGACLLAVLAFQFGASAASIIAQWTFEGGRLVPSAGTGTLSLLGVRGALVSGDPGQSPTASHMFTRTTERHSRRYNVRLSKHRDPHCAEKSSTSEKPGLV